MSTPSRRKFLKYLALGAVGAAAVGAAGYATLVRPSSTGNTSTRTSSYVPPSNATPDYSEFMDWLASASAPYSGQSIDLSLEFEFSPLALQKRDPDFYSATGIDVNYNLQPYALHLQNISTMVQTKAPTYDIFSVDYQDIGSFKDYILSPTELADKYPDITYEPIKQGDFQDIPWSYCAAYPPLPFQSSGESSTSTNIAAGDILFIPNNMATMIQYYRTDLFQASGLSPAQNWDDYVSNAIALDTSKARFGTVNEASPNISIVVEFMNILAGYGGGLWQVNNGNITSTLDSDAALTALETYVKLQPNSDPASFTYTWDDVTNQLIHGIGAEALQFEGYDAYINDPARSQVVGEMGYTIMPSGSAGSFSLYGGDGLAVSAYSKHPEIAWLWLQWATSLGTQEMTLLDTYHAFPSRTGVFNDSLVQQALGSSNYNSVAVTKKVWDSGQIATLLPFPKWIDVLDPIAYNLSQAWASKQTPQDSLSAAIQQIETWGSLQF